MYIAYSYYDKVVSTYASTLLHQLLKEVLELVASLIAELIATYIIIIDCKNEDHEDTLSLYPHHYGGLSQNGWMMLLVNAI